MTRLNGNSGSSIDDISERRLVAYKRASVWFFTLLAAPTAVALIASVLTFSSNQNYSGLGAFTEIFIMLEILIIIPFLIHAFFTAYVIRLSPLRTKLAFFTAWGGTIGIIIPFGAFWSVVIFDYDTHSTLGEQQDFIIMIFMIPIEVASAVCGYILGFGLGLIAEKLIVGKDQ